MATRHGALSCSVHTSSWSSYCWANVYWAEEQGENDDCKGLVVLPSALQLYYKKKYIKIFDPLRKERDSQSRTVEDELYFDVESDPKHGNVNPGTVTIEGFGLECWEYAERYGLLHIKTILSNATEIPGITAPQILRRIQELKMNPPLNTLGRDKEYEDLREFGGSFGTTYAEPFSTRKYEVHEQILNLYMMLNRQDIFTNFTQISSIGFAALLVEDGKVQLWNFLLQMILSRELARRLECFPAGHVLSGLSVHVLASVIAADVWIRNVDLVIVDGKAADAEAKTPSESGEEKGAGESEKADEKDQGEGQDGSNEADKLGLRNEPFSLKNKDLEMHSLIHGSQVDGLLHFAEALSWPYLSEARQTAPTAYRRMRDGERIKVELWDWLYGTTLPGKWAALKIMAALVLVSPSIADSVGVPDYFDCGLSLPQRSYWRSRTVLGRVLGGLTGVKGQCGWIGPCPPVDGVGTQGKYIRLQAQPVAPPEYKTDVFYVHSPEVGVGLAPSSPKQRKTKCTVENIVVEPLPLEDGVNEGSRQYRASVVFKITNATKAPISVKFTLHNNPVFVTPPQCKSAHPGIIGGHWHTVHPWQLPKFRRSVWNIEELAVNGLDVDVLLGRVGNTVMVINATGEGMETLARAWCSEKGKSAVVRRSPGACFVCAWNVACGLGLGLNVLIWVS